MDTAPRDPFLHLLRLAETAGLADQPTPFLTVDLGAMERNIEKMSAFFRSRPANLRPHVKHHKCTEIARLQIDAGAVGVTCSTTDEVKAMVDAGIDDVLLANVVMDRTRVDLLAQAATSATVTVAADSLESIQLLSEAARRADSTLQLVIEVDIGMRRNGVATPEEAVELAEFTSSLPCVHFRGVMAYEGHVVRIADRQERAKAVSTAFAQIEDLLAKLDRYGFNSSMVTGGASSTYDFAGCLPFMTDVQAGTYVLMDATYANLVPEFEPALVTIATVLTSRANRPLVVDVGAKRLATDIGSPRLIGFEASHCGTAEEHNRFDVKGRRPKVGDRVAIVPGHACSTVSLYRSLFGCRAGKFERVLHVDARDPLA